MNELISIDRAVKLVDISDIKYIRHDVTNRIIGYNTFSADVGHNVKVVSSDVLHAITRTILLEWMVITDKLLTEIATLKKQGGKSTPANKLPGSTNTKSNLPTVKKDNDKPIDEKDKLIKKLTDENNKLKYTIGKFETRTKSTYEDINSLKQQIKDFEATYGKFTNPYFILRQIYNSGGYGEFNMCVTFAKMKIKPPKKGYDYWMQIFKTIHIVRETRKGVFQCIMDYSEANHALYKENPSFRHEDIN